MWTTGAVIGTFGQVFAPLGVLGFVVIWFMGGPWWPYATMFALGVLGHSRQKVRLPGLYGHRTYYPQTDENYERLRRIM